MSGSGHLALVAFAAMITPGPNNILVTDVAATRSVAATAGVIASIVLGSMVMLAITQMSLISLLSASPFLHLGIKLMSVGVLVGLGLMMMLSSSGIPDGKRDENPIRPLVVLVLQFANPKGWAVMLAIGALDVSLGSAFLIVRSISLACLCVWAMAGIAFGRLLIDARRKRIFSASMGALLIVSAPLVVI